MCSLYGELYPETNAEHGHGFDLAVGERGVDDIVIELPEALVARIV